MRERGGEGGRVNKPGVNKNALPLYRGQVWETRKRKVASDQCRLVHCTLRQGARERGSEERERAAGGGEEGLPERSANLIFLWASYGPPPSHPCA